MRLDALSYERSPELAEIRLVAHRPENGAGIVAGDLGDGSSRLKTNDGVLNGAVGARTGE